MHGRAKKQITEKEKEKKAIEQARKLKLYKSYMNIIQQKREQQQYDDDAIKISENLLIANPDVYTVWNFRKEIVLDCLQRKHYDEVQLGNNELSLTEACLKVHPKSYGAWYHRIWVLRNVPNMDLKKELSLCEKYLKFDERNFHCWDYRRQIVKLIGIDAEREIKFTTEKIIDNFSNYSSWHYRSKLLPLLYPDVAQLRPIQENVHLDELELVQNASFTDPSDSSAWFYLFWLLGPNKFIKIQPVRAIKIKNNVIVSFNRHLYLNMKVIVKHKDKFLQEVSNSTGNIISVSGIHEINEFHLIIDDKEYEIVLNTNGPIHFWMNKTNFLTEFSENLLNVLKDQLKVLNQLIELEPESKWALITSVLLMHAIDRELYEKDILNRLLALSKIDFIRKNYYMDLRSRYILEFKLENQQDLLNINLSNLELTTIYHSQYLITALSINLSNNQFVSIPSIQDFINCQDLDLSNNNITTLSNFPSMENLKYLNLSNNKLNNNINLFNEVITILEKMSQLISVDLRNNEIDDSICQKFNQNCFCNKVIF